MSRSILALAFLLPPIVAGLASCGDDSATGTVEDATLELDTLVDSVIEIISFDTQETETPTPPEDTGGALPDGTSPPEDTAVTPDGQDGCRTFGCPCNSNADCLDEFCIESADGQVCTRTCIADCPADFDCLSVTSFGADPVSVCVPRHTRLCRPCRADAECDDPGDPFPAYCLASPDDDPPGATGRFCGSSCANRACPEGYACEDVALMGGGNARQCVPVAGECACRPAWSDLGYSTDCLVSNTFGSCDGTRSCTANGLSPCLGQQATPEICDGADNDCDELVDNLAETPCMVQNQFGQCPGQLGCEDDAPKCLGPEPLAESCNGLDDDCDGQTDESTCNDDLACTTDTCAAPNQCQNALVAGNCLVNGACYATGQFNPLNACEVCDPAKSTASFSQAANTCVINGQCYPANATNPENACQICLPGQSATAWSTASNTCQIGGACYAANQANPLNPCEICSPVSSTTAWTQALNTCNIQGQCYAAGVKNPQNECLICDPTKSATGWSNAPVTQACDDANACSATSFCDGTGACEGDTSCNDGIACTRDICDSRSGCRNDEVETGFCRINGVCYTDNTANPENPCQRCAPATSQTAWSPQPTTVSCSDDNLCTQGDACDGAGACKPGTGCNDGLSCTTDTCNPATGCTFPTSDGFCRINDGCYADNATRGGSGVDVCYECEPSESQSAWTFKTNKACNDNDACSNNDKCTNNACVGTPIVDSYDANGLNNTRATADYLGKELRADFDNWHEFTASLYGPGDEDWYTYRANDDGASQVQPFPDVKLQGIPANMNYQLCVWWDCDDPGSGEQVDCQAGSPATALDGHKGCCSSNPGSASEHVKIKAGCDNATVFDDDVGTVIIRVYNATNNWTCSNYTLLWGED